MLLDGMFGTTRCSRLLGPALGAARFSDVPVAGRRGLLGTDLAAAPGTGLGRGGGKGDIEMEVTEAECAWYTRRL